MYSLNILRSCSIANCIIVKKDFFLIGKTDFQLSMNFLLQFILTKVIKLLQKREVCVRDWQNGTSRIIVRFLFNLFQMY